MIEAFDARIEEVMSPLEQEAVKRLDEMPGFDRRTGTDRARRDRQRHEPLSHARTIWLRWAGLCPGNNESAGKRKGGKTRKANRWLKAALTQAAWARQPHATQLLTPPSTGAWPAAAATSGPRMAVAHGLLVTVHCLLSRGTSYVDLGPHYFTKLETDDQHALKLVRKLQRLGYDVEVNKTAA